MQTRLLSVLVFATMISVGTVRQVQAQPCSNASLRGTYGFHALTFIGPGIPGPARTIIGVFTLDGRGNWTANLTLNDNGTILLKPNEGGTYIVKQDCTGTLFPTSGGSVELVVVDGGREFFQMRTAPPSIIMYGTSKKVSSGNGEEQ